MNNSLWPAIPRSRRYQASDRQHPIFQPFPVNGRIELRVRGHYDPLQRWGGRHEVLPAHYSLFVFVLVANVISIPCTFTITSHIIVTAAFALLVFFTVIIYGFYKNGLKFRKIFVPSGVPVYILPLVVVTEIISFLSRPLSHSVHLFANMLAGHITLKVFAGLSVCSACRSEQSVGSAVSCHSP
jgi:ATP synthase subunit 6